MSDTCPKCGAKSRTGNSGFWFFDPGIPITKAAGYALQAENARLRAIIVNLSAELGGSDDPRARLIAAQAAEAAREASKQ